ncbi:Triacylglycerol lipase [Klebsormidium nitens]|uniref:Triacylglycerol lipase n=1 Tax=Klebsormidium nitens TaxID=105231 RepID=A0A1Y1I4H5_KLENI|nr:Triacylglycerol lipase [Klebsormidium nitens]|eukprot:GAQ84071.1 Triacylglycerol lipase [Klebsormidium nitens]
MPAAIMAATAANGGSSRPPTSPTACKGSQGLPPLEKFPAQGYLHNIWQGFRSIVAYLLWPVHYIHRVGWQRALASAIMCLLTFFHGKPLRKLGIAMEWLGNSILGPDKDTKCNLTVIGLLDRNFTLDEHTVTTFPSETPSARTNALVCCMASKVIYEDDRLVEHVVNNVWNKNNKGEKFKFIEWYHYTTQGQDRVDTQAMLVKKGHAVIVAFRGTQPFSVVDWATDFRFSWWDGIPPLGRVHIGFLESLGLGAPIDDEDPSEKDESTRLEEDEKLRAFSKYINLCQTRHRQGTKRRDDTAGRKSRADVRDPQTPASDESEADVLARFLKDYVLEDKSALANKAAPLSEEVCDQWNVRDNAPLYWKIRLALANALRADPEAKVYITGHSLGGALAALFAGLLAAENDVMAERIGGLYTFGQPRIGDWSFAEYLHNKLNLPEQRYVRLIYANDLVPRVPFNSSMHQYKHLGPYHVSNAFYAVTVGTSTEQPAMGVIAPYLTIILEFWYNVVWNEIANLCFRDVPRPRETCFQMLVRALSMFAPRIAAHNPANYLNAVRYGFPHGEQKKQPPT